MNNSVGSELKDNQCTGCGLCVNSCPVKAITLTSNSLGVSVRCVDESRCVSCGKCKAMCPQINRQELKLPLKCLAVYPQAKYHDGRFSSGGAASLIARAFMKKTGGVVCGCTWDNENGKAKHIVVDRPEELSAFYGSKYVQSDIQEIYTEIEGIIGQRRKVLFIGTPCQVAAVRRMCSSENLLTMDLICHGTPPMSFLAEYLRTISNRKIWDVRFRGKRDFWLTAYDEKGKEIYSEYKDCDPYFHSFLKGTIYRDNCYSCIYARIERVSDITVGDFWEIDRCNISYDGNISLALINTANGKRLLQDTSEYLMIYERSLEEAVKGNLQLSAPMQITDEQREFRALMEKEGSFVNALKKTTDYQSVCDYKKKWHRMMRRHKIKVMLNKLLGK